ncbi:unnamed protein product [Diabrotica balteata]|uniref:Cytochrome c domain-containing protein n=1 Tax=Diabrotica balteata TaxID=107213 RepID=A0A9N9XCE4_DIABA|nr:unnamed protein product [Diabrotica balteata]
MAHLPKIFILRISPFNTCFIRKLHTYSSNKSKNWRKKLIGALGLIIGGTGVLLCTLNSSVRASILELCPPKNKWDHQGLITALDHASIRRGYEVYKQACISCHSLRYVAYRHLVGVTHTEAEAKAEAQEQMIVDGPDEEGNMYERPGKLSDFFRPPYPNEEAARAANNGAFPADLTYVILGRKHAEDYMFSLLTGYYDPPAGVVLRDGQYYNPYFIGGATAMGPPLFDDSAEYSDGTPAYASQLAKDVTVFLKWAGEPEFDHRQRMMVKVLTAGSVLVLTVWFVFRFRFMTLRARKFQYRPKG